MGLDISSKSKKDYHYSYSGIYYIRFMAYRTSGGDKPYLDYYSSMTADEFPDDVEKAIKQFPNLCWHSDCDGTYTVRGKVASYENPGTLQKGNSKGLLSELQYIKDNLPKKHDPTVTDRDWYVFNMLYELVKDVVENYDGKIEFN